MGIGVLEHDNLACMGVGVLHLMCVQIFIIFLFRVLGEILVDESYILHVRSWMTKSSYSMTSKSNGYYRERASSKDNLARMGVRVLYPTCVQIFIIFLFRGLGGILVEEESYILHIKIMNDGGLI
jgi:hypothetical protein